MNQARAPRAATVLRAAFLLAALGSALATVAHADPSRRVVVVRPANADAVTIEALARVTGELGAAGFQIVSIPVEATADQRAVVESIGRDENPVAAFAIFAGPTSPTGQPTAEIWVSDRQKGTATVQRMRVDPGDATRSAAVLAVHAVEFLRASLAELWHPPEASPPPPPAPEPKPPSTTTTISRAADVVSEPEGTYLLSRLALEVAGGILTHAGGFSPTWTPALRLSYGGSRGLGLRVGLAAGGQASSVANQPGTGTLHHQLFTLEGVIAFRPGARVQPFGTLVAGAYRIGVSGTSNDQSVWFDRSTQIWSATAGATAGAVIALGSHVGLVLSAEALLFLPRPTVALGDGPDAVVGRAGRPAFLLTAGLLAF